MQSQSYGWPVTYLEFKPTPYSIYGVELLESTDTLIKADEKIVVTAHIQAVVLDKKNISIVPIKGVIPDLALPYLETLDLSGKLLEGLFPQLDMPNLKFFDLSENYDVTGTLPSYDLPSLENLNLSYT